MLLLKSTFGDDLTKYIERCVLIHDENFTLVDEKNV